MLFDVQEDLGWRISAYLIPDSGDEKPAIRILRSGAELARLEANLSLPAVVAAGLHATGLCGFTIDETLIPGLSDISDIELADSKSGILIYRRPPPGAFEEKKIFRLETSLLPLWRLDDIVKPRFQSWYRGIDRYGRETSTQIFCLTHNQSLYASGRVLYKNYEYYLRNDISTVALLRDPYHELAERLLILKQVGSAAKLILGARDAITFAPLMGLLADIEPLNEEGCRRLFKMGQKQDYEFLFNPLARQLTATSPNEPLSLSAVTASIEVLSSFSLLGVRSREDDFIKGLAELVDLGTEVMPPLAEHFRVINLSAQLRAIPWIEAFLEQDLEIFRIVTAAFNGAPGQVNAVIST